MAAHAPAACRASGANRMLLVPWRGWHGYYAWLLCVAMGLCRLGQLGMEPPEVEAVLSCLPPETAAPHGATITLHDFSRAMEMMSARTPEI